MCHRVNARLLALVVALTLAATADQAGAEGLSLSNQSFRATWTTMSFSGAFGTTSCRVTLEGSFHSTSFGKTVDTLLGYITRATSSTCTNGTMRVLTESLPWHVRYMSFTGTLPNITSLAVSVVGASFSIREAFGNLFLGRSTTERPLILSHAREAAGAITSAAATGTFANGGECFGLLTEVSGSGTVTLLNSTARIRLILLEGSTFDIATLPISPIRIPAGGVEEVTLTILGTGHAGGRLRITNIAIIEDVNAAFEIRDEAGCREGTIFIDRAPTNCKFLVNAKPGREGNQARLQIRYRLANAAAEHTKTLVVEST
jgi:hypothetical protein